MQPSSTPFATPSASATAAPVRLLVMDVDGTLLTDTKRLLPEVKLAVRQAVESGLHVALATGRMYAAVAPWVRELGLRTPQICNNGADIVDPVSGACLRNVTLDPAAAAQALRFGRERGVAMALFTGDRVLTPAKTADHWLIERNREPVDEIAFEQLVAAPPPAEKLLFLDRAHPETLPPLRDEFVRRFRADDGPAFMVEITEPGILNICHPLSGKAPALRDLCDHLGITPANVAAIGDSDNDAGMLALAGFGIAMRNATPPSLAAARHVTDSNAAAGVVPAICETILGGVPPGGPGDLALKLRRLRLAIRGYGSALVAFSGGVDSSLVLTLAAEELPPERVLAATAHSAVFPAADRTAADDLAGRLGVRRQILDTDAQNADWYACNPENRCYVCKRAFFGRLRELAREAGLAEVVDGENLDDLGAHRPGRQAALECGVRSPLADCALTKADVRALSRELGLEGWQRPANACLATRFPYGTELRPDRLAAVARAEELLKRKGFGQVRVRVFGDLARIEVEPARVLQAQIAVAALAEEMRACGFRETEIDPRGYRTGSMDEPAAAAP